MQPPTQAELPLDLVISRASFFATGSEVSRVTAGLSDQIQEWTFLCHVPRDFGYWQTVVAFKTPVPLRELSTLWRAAELACERLGNYLLVYRPRTEISSKVIQLFVEDCRGLLGYLKSGG
jgi:hypothetical protein